MYNIFAWHTTSAIMTESEAQTTWQIRVNNAWRDFRRHVDMSEAGTVMYQ